MKLKKRKERTKRLTPTWVDWLILLLIAALMFFGLRYIKRRRSQAAPTVTVSYVLCLSAVDTAYVGDGNGFEELISVGSKVTSANGTAPLGEVSQVWTEQHTVPAVQKGKVVFVEVPNRVDLYVKVRGNAVAKTGDGLRISDIRIAAGGVGDYRIGGFTANAATVVSVTKGGKA